MERYRKLELKLKDTVAAKDKQSVYDFCACGEMELIHFEGETKVWADSIAAENLGIELMRKGKHHSFERFPKRYAETTDMSEEGKPNKTNTKKLVEVTPVNLSKHTTLLSSIPAEYIEEVEID
jgi:hypothetical protein